MHFQIAADEQGTPSFEGVLGRINVVLGTNGSGKSKLLGAICLTATEQETELEIVRVTASRKEYLPGNFSTQTQNGKLFDNFDEDVIKDFEYLQQTPEQIKQSIVDPAMFFHETRLQQALRHFSTSLGSEKVEYRKRHYEWMATGGQTTPPDVPEDRDAEAHFDKLLSLFNEIFPEIKIKAKNFRYTEKVFIDQSQKNQRVNLHPDLLKNPQVTGNYSFELTCLKNQQEYSPSALSEGEKQIFAMLADRYLYRKKKCLFLVDEPELNLDPVLAIKYWNLLEREMPDSVFVYTTHSLDFALRDNVNRIWSLGRGMAKPIPLETLGGLPADEQRRFLSGIRGIITTNKGLVVEGMEASFDAKFYPWILGDNESQFQISGYGSCNDVQAATKKLDIWQQMVPASQILGIVDADYKSEEEVKQLAESTCVSLSLHDAESFLCHPDLLTALATKMGRAPFPTREELLVEIVDFLEETILDICHHRLTRRCRASVQISLRNEELAQISDLAQLKDRLGKAADAYAGSDLGINKARVKEVLNEEYRRCVTAKSNKDVMELLNLVKGKDLLSRFSSHFGLANGLEVMNYVVAHLSPDEFDHTRVLGEQIQARFATSGDDTNDSRSSRTEAHTAHETPPTVATASEESDAMASDSKPKG